MLSVWVLMCYALGPSLFFKIYLISLSLAGGAGIVLFTVQHNFRHSYASDGHALGLRHCSDRRYQLS